MDTHTHTEQTDELCFISERILLNCRSGIPQRNRMLAGVLDGVNWIVCDFVSQELGDFRLGMGQIL